MPLRVKMLPGLLGSGLLLAGMLLVGAPAANNGANADDKPSPVPSRARPSEPPKNWDKNPAYVPVAPTSSPEKGRDSDANSAVWSSAQGGTAVYFSDNVRGKRAASGLVLDPDELIAAHATLPFGTRVRVTNIKNGKEVTVRVVDRISASSSHIISVSEKAAAELDFRRTGIGQVKIIPLGPSNP